MSFATALSLGLLLGFTRDNSTSFQPASLKDELAFRHVPVMDAAMLKVVADHKRKKLRELRPGLLRFVMPLARLPAHVLALVSLYYPIVGTTDDNQRQDTWIGVMLLSMVLGFCCWIAAMALSGESTLLLIGSVLVTPLIAGVLLLLMVEGFDLIGLMQAFDGRWRLFRLKSTVDVLPNPTVPNIPDHLKRRIVSAWDIPGTRVYLEWLGTDPFIVAHRGFWVFAEKHVIGAYATGNRLLDGFGR